MLADRMRMSVSAEKENELLGTWLFNDVIDFTKFDVSTAFDFYSDGVLYNILVFVTIGATQAIQLQYQKIRGGSRIDTAYSGYWRHPNFKTIEIVDVSGLSESSSNDLLNFLTNNATKKSSVPVVPDPEPGPGPGPEIVTLKEPLIKDNGIPYYLFPEISSNGVSVYTASMILTTDIEKSQDKYDPDSVLIKEHMGGYERTVIKDRLNITSSRRTAKLSFSFQTLNPSFVLGIGGDNATTFLNQKHIEVSKVEIKNTDGDLVLKSIE